MRRRITFLTCGFFLLFTSVTFAQDWTGAGDGTTWEDPANWAGGVLPSGNTDIGDLATVSLSTNQSIGELDVVGDQSVGTAVLNQTAGTLSGGGWAKVGVDSGNDGTWNLSGTASSTGHSQLHAGSRGGTGVINLTDSASISHSQSLRLSDDNAPGSGTLNVSNNASINTGDDWNVGNNNGGLGVVNLSDSATATVADRVSIGFNGTGTLNIDDSAVLTAGSISGSNGVGTAVINQTSGTVNSNTWVAIGQGGDPNASTTYNHSGGTLNQGLVNMNENLVIGENGAGTYNASGTADVNASGVLIGRNAGATFAGDGLLVLDGSSITFDTGDLSLGLDSDGDDDGASGEISFIADAGGVSTIFSADTTSFGANASLLIDLTADAAFSTFDSAGTGTLTDIAVLIDNVNNVSSSGLGGTLFQFAGVGEGSLVDIGGGQQAFLTYNGGADGNDIVLQTFINAIPEPTSLALLGLGSIGMLVRRKRS